MILRSISAIAAVIFLPVTVYIAVGMIVMRKRMYQHLKDQGVKKADIRSVMVMHSFLNLLLRRPEWEIEVMFNDEPHVVYFFQYSHTRKKIAIRAAKHLTAAAITDDQFKHYR